MEPDIAAAWIAAWIGANRRLIGMIAFGILLLAIVGVLFVPGADWLARYDVGSAAGSLHETAVDNARGRLLTLLAGLLAAAALLFRGAELPPIPPGGGDRPLHQGD